MKCSQVTCEATATHRIRFNILAKTGDEPVIAEPEIYCCDEHATEEAARELLIDNEAGKKQIEHMMAGAHKAPPDWTRSFAEWFKIWHKVDPS